ncbi:MAG: Type-2 restriction enzyme MjaIII [Candidatus Moranbacteria bacterium GW2011_GWC2_37_73]|nr:MAG: Type-2 restriction enzyme MjaIII [Parcubacteria group bacterium GW2011_GWC1_36_108]KKQ00560.1 MAG: Type-2 restriction enzyme MjaIII [Candidatus Moranbacteria bacterium GW2011_GWD1_36_198]KKQ01840.1 MAG: Type-2 restriction enzyme MjaIII [Candidatus Moranbacteria bacterium GW2011_GWD2_36_198]KKQ40448.1 MAG: Type-2 restriction enzyme MjaIII [Candidatus Moranbacteria bacterium GW2011_GWC2_37_73]HAS00118.1 restriction endonuclease [Candidatus Moranbacteria bacterium]
MQKDFQNLVDTLKNSIKTWEYFVNWEKVFTNSSEMEIILNKLNYLLGKEDLKAEFKTLYETNSDVVKAFPVLLAVREKQLEIFELSDGSFEIFDFKNNEAGVDNFEKYYMFLERTGLINLFKKEGIKNLVDYVIGVEVGLDSNGRKNRGGSLMEKIVESHIGKLCEQKGFEYIAQASSTEIRNKWGVEVKVNKSERSFDFAVFNPENKKIKLFEVNFYNGGGSKLKAVCGEFKDLYRELKEQGIDFVWVTDGLGWHTTKRPLEETYNNNEYVFNLQMVEQGSLEELAW